MAEVKDCLVGAWEGQQLCPLVMVRIVMKVAVVMVVVVMMIKMMMNDDDHLESGNSMMSQGGTECVGLARC